MDTDTACINRYEPVCSKLKPENCASSFSFNLFLMISHSTPLLPYDRYTSILTWGLLVTTTQSFDTFVYTMVEMVKS